MTERASTIEHCDCDECRRDRDLLLLMREIMPLLIILARAQSVAAVTVARKWEAGSGETLFRRVLNGQKEYQPE